jgi:hypothetical protein
MNGGASPSPHYFADCNRWCPGSYFIDEVDAESNWGAVGGQRGSGRSRTPHQRLWRRRRTPQKPGRSPGARGVPRGSAFVLVPREHHRQWRPCPVVGRFKWAALGHLLGLALEAIPGTPLVRITTCTRSLPCTRGGGVRAGGSRSALAALRVVGRRWCAQRAFPPHPR